MDRYTMHGSNGGVRPIESDTGEWVKFSDFAESNNSHIEFASELLAEKDKQIENLLLKISLEINGDKMPSETYEIVKSLNGDVKVKAIYHDQPGYCKEGA